ncbi:ACT domain repeat 8 [Tanacetum coccineum]|uniref:ACT domain repeat 8 n=1 Tax=Tanacetum coccineum TaxID=301880 RepID=A0ABQ4WTT6_9ASTR
MYVETRGRMEIKGPNLIAIFDCLMRKETGLSVEEWRRYGTQAINFRRENAMNVTKAEISTGTGIARNVLYVTNAIGNPVDSKVIDSVMQRIGSGHLRVKELPLMYHQKAENYDQNTSSSLGGEVFTAAARHLASSGVDIYTGLAKAVRALYVNIFKDEAIIQFLNSKDSIRLQSNLKGLNSSLEFIQLHENFNHILMAHTLVVSLSIDTLYVVCCANNLFLLLFKQQIKSAAVDGNNIIASVKQAREKFLAMLAAIEAAAKLKAQKEEERIAELKKI